MSLTPLGIPRLGQGFRGGAAALGLGGTPLGGGGGLPRANVGLAPRTPGPVLGGVTPPPVVATESPARKALRLATAQQILDRVRRGQLDVVAANDMLSDLPDEDRHDLTKALLQRSAAHGEHHHDELQALGFIPLGISAGHSGHAYQGAGHGIGSNLLKDVGTTVTGFAPGVAIASRALGQDVSDFFHGRPTQGHFGHEVVAPIAHQYAQTYGPLAHGDVGKFGARFVQHPLGPILDAAAVVSGGIGGAVRAGDAASALRLGAVERLPGGVGAPTARVGGTFRVIRGTNGWRVTDNTGKSVAQGLPTEGAAIAHAQSIMTGGLSGDALNRVLRGATRKGARGSLLEQWDKAFKITHADEEVRTVSEVMSVLNNPHLQLGRRSLRQVWGDFKKDVSETRTAGIARGQGYIDQQGNWVPPTLASQNRGFIGGEKGALRVVPRAGGAALTSLREVSDFIRASAIYLRPAYLPNNWAGNLFMNSVQQGALAPVNLAKSLVMDQHLGQRYTHGIDVGMGHTPASAVMGEGRGYVRAATQPIAQVMGAAADVPFRRAAFLHEARKMGYGKLDQVKELMDRVAAGDGRAQNEFGQIARRAQEEIVKFSHMNDMERSVIRHVFFVYSWMRGAARYTARFPMQHPIQAAVDQHLGQEGQAWVDKEMGGMPSFLIGSIPVGRDKNGDPLLINPFALNPLGSGLSVVRALAGAAEVAKPVAESIVKGRVPSTQFNKFAQQDLVDLAPPLVQAYLQAREGEAPNLKNSIAFARLANEQMHPGQGSIFPMNRRESAMHFAVGPMYPRHADPQAIARSLERENQQNPVAMIPHEVKQYEKLTGVKIPKSFVGAYRGDLEASQMMKDFQTQYAQDHGASGFHNLPPGNRADAALKFLVKFHYISHDDAKSYADLITSLPHDAAVNDLANSLWASTGIGQIKRQWRGMINDAKGLRLTRTRQ